MKPSVIRKKLKAAKTGKCCGGCGRKLGAGDPVWRKRVGLGYGLMHWRTAMVPLCERCKPDAAWHPTHSSGACEGCGRPVHNTEGPRRRRHVFCSERCVEIYQSAVARQRRSEARGTTRACGECGEYFEPARADAKFCSGACRQKAHRKRVTDVKCSASVADSRNAVARREVSP